MRRIFAIPFLLFFLSAARAQSPRIKASIDKNKILIGEPLQLIIETESRTGAFIRIDTIPHFEFSGFPEIDTIDNGNSVTVKGVYTITSFDSGRWSIPSFQLAPNIISDSLVVDVTFSPFDPNQDYHTIKDIIETSEAGKRFEWWWFAAGGILLVALLYYFLRKKKGIQKLPAARSSLSALDEAMRQLELLVKNKPASKEYYSALSDIFRMYILKTKGIRSLQKTTDDFVIQLAGIDVGKENFYELIQVLRLSDFVKFAKYPASAEDDDFAYQTIKNAIRQIEKTNTKELPAGALKQ